MLGVHPDAHEGEVANFFGYDLSVLFPRSHTCSLLHLLLQLCNHPSLVVNDDSSNALDRRGGRAKKKICYAEEEKSSAAPGADGIAKFMPYEAMGGGRNAPVMPELSGKMFTLWRLMREMRKPGNGGDVSAKSVLRCDFIVLSALTSALCLSNHRKSSSFLTTLRRWTSSDECVERITGVSVAWTEVYP